MSEPTVLLVHGAFADASIWQPVVYVAGPVPDEGESVADLQSYLPSLLMAPLHQRHVLPDGEVIVSLAPDHFHNLFCADLLDREARFLARAQRPLLATAFEDPADAASWRSKPSWAVFGSEDVSVTHELHRFQSTRAGSTVTEVEGLTPGDAVQTRRRRRRHPRGGEAVCDQLTLGSDA